MWRQTLTIKHVNIPKDYSRSMNTERGKATAFPPARAPASPEERRQKENITYFPVALATHTHEEESPWFCKVPMVDAVGAQIPFIWQLHLSPASVSVRQLPLYPEICPWSVGNHFWEMPGILCPSHQWPTAYHWLIQSSKGCPPCFKEGIPWYNSCSRALCGIRLRLDFSWTHTLTPTLSLSCLISLFLGKLKRAPQSFAQQSVSGSAFRESTQDCFLCLLSASWLYGSQEKKKIMEQGQNGRKEQSQGILLSRLHTFLGSIPLF